MNRKSFIYRRRPRLAFCIVAVILISLLSPGLLLATPTMTSIPSPLTESTLNDSLLNITLGPSDGQFSVVTASTLAFTLHNAPPGMTVSGSTITSTTTATVDLNFDGTVFNSDINNFYVELDQSILTTSSDLNTSTLPIISEHAPASLTISSATALREATLDSSTVAVTLAHEQFKDNTLARSNFTLTGAPAGVTVGGVVYVSPTSATVILDYDGTDFYSDYNFTLTISGTELHDNIPLTSNSLPILADTSSANANLSDLKVAGTTITSFSSSTTAYNYTLAPGSTSVPAVTATTQDPHANAVITPATGISGTAAVRTTTIEVTAQDGLTKKTYTVTFSRAPQMLSTIPAANAANVNENAIYSRTVNGETRYFLQVVFSDPDSTLQIPANFLDLLRTSMVYAEGGNRSSLVDRDLLAYAASQPDPDAYIRQNFFVSSGTTKILYVPIRKLGSNMTYIVELNAGLVQYSDGTANSLITWTFSTMPVPSATEISIGSVSEDYDESEPIIINGDNFNSDVSVYFNSTAAYKVKVKTYASGKQYLEVFLPRGSKHLSPGIYTIKIKNGTDHEVEILGSFCVIEASDVPAPTNGEQIISEDSLGEIVQKTTTSETILRLSGSYSNTRSLSIDLDDLMGTDVLVRRIEFPSGGQVNIGALKTYSQWADIALYGVQANTYAGSGTASITLGRVPYSTARDLKGKLSRYAIKSDFIQVGGDNFEVESVEIHLPYHMSDGSNLKMMRYDYSTRTFSEISAMIDPASGIIIAGRIQPGIFVAVE